MAEKLEIPIPLPEGKMGKAERTPEHKHGMIERAKKTLLGKMIESACEQVKVDPVYVWDKYYDISMTLADTVAERGNELHGKIVMPVLLLIFSEFRSDLADQLMSATVSDLLQHPSILNRITEMMNGAEGQMAQRVAEAVKDQKAN